MKFRSTGIAIMLAAIWLATPSTASAQVGVLVGLNVTNVNFDVGNDNSGLTITGDRRTGFIGGLSFNIPVQDMFSVELDALFAQKGTKFTFDGDTGKIKLNYLDVPVLGRINVPKGPAGLHLLFGPSFNFKLSESFDPDENNSTEDEFEKVETSLVIGGGVHMSRFRIEVRYGVGLSNIVKDSATDGLFTGKNKVFSILAGI